MLSNLYTSYIEDAYLVHIEWNRYSSIGIATGYGLQGRGSILDSVRCFSSPQRPDRLWGSPTLLSHAYHGLFPWRQSGRGVKLTTIVQKSRNVELYLHSLRYLHGIELN
jgi:hypothetical protein